MGVYSRNLKACVIEIGGSAVARCGLMRWADEVPANRSDQKILPDPRGCHRLSILHGESPTRAHGQQCDGIKIDFRIAMFFNPFQDITFMYI